MLSTCKQSILNHLMKSSNIQLQTQKNCNQCNRSSITTQGILTPYKMTYETIKHRLHKGPNIKGCVRQRFLKLFCFIGDLHILIAKTFFTYNVVNT